MKKLFFLLFLLQSISLFGQKIQDSEKVCFCQGRFQSNPTFCNNEVALNRILDNLRGKNIMDAFVGSSPDSLWHYLKKEHSEFPETEKVSKVADNPIYMSIKTNLLCDMVTIPNIGVEFYLGKEWSISINWMYAWWHLELEHWYWRIYGGELAFRKWFGKKVMEKPLTGHHIGIYWQLMTYDFETGGKGVLSDSWSYGGGIEYGYAHPIGKRLNLDFTIGVGYLGGEYKEYIPENDCYVWQITKNRNWIGPTKAEISLVCLLGRENYNKEKGGRK